MRSTFRIFLVVIAALALPASPSPGQEGADPGRSRWNNEELFDSTTTREELLEMARSAVTMSQLPLAEVYYQELLIRNPDDVAVMYELAALYRRTDRLEYARGLLVRAGRFAPDRNDIAETRREVERDLFAQVTREVDRLVADGKYNLALPRIGVLLTIDGENADALAKKARCLAAIGESDAALSNIQLAITKDPRDEFYRLRDDIARQVERRRINDLETSARRLLESGDWVRDEAADVLQALLAQDPSNEWAREQFRALSSGPAPPPLPSDPPAPQQVVDAVRDVAPPLAAALRLHLPAILVFLGVVVVFFSPLTRALVARLPRPSQFSGDLARIDVADVLRVAHVSVLSGVMVLKTPEGAARVYLEDGEPVHCTGFRRTGVDALTYAIENIREGRFIHRDRRFDGTRTIDQPLDLILADGVAAPGGAKGARVRKKSRMSELLENKVD